MSGIFTNPVVSIVVLIGILIFVHEFGHFIVGRLFGFGIETFSIGFGPKIFGFKRGETEFQISLLPLGGYVKFVGAMPGEIIPSQFEGKELSRFPVWQRALMTFAGPFANLFLAFVVFVAVGMNGLKHPPAVIGHVRSGSPADQAGILPGDRITKINQMNILHWDDLLISISSAQDQSVPLTVLRDGQAISLNLTPELKDDEDHNGKNIKVGRIGVSPLVFPNSVAVLPDSIAGELGFQNGDEIVSAQFATVTPSDGNSNSANSNRPTDISETTSESLNLGNWNALVYALSKALHSSNQGIHSVTTFTLNRRLQSSSSKSDAGENSPQNSSDDINKPSNPASAAPEPASAAPEPAMTIAIKSEVFTKFKDWKTASGNLNQDDSQFGTGRLVAEFLGFRDGSLLVMEAGKDSGLRNLDYLVSMDGHPIRDVFDLNERSLANRQPKLPFELIRDGKKINVDLSLKPLELQKPKGKEVVYLFPAKVLGGSNPEEIVMEKYSGLSSLRYGAERTIKATASIFESLVGLFTGKVPLQSLGGPMLIAKAAKDSAEAGIYVYLTTMAMISINLFLINLFPIPALDGGHLVMQSIEAIRRKPLSVSAMENYQKIGFAFILALVILSTYNDIGRFWGSFLGGSK